MTDAEKREAARQIYNKWVNKGKEDEDDRSFWMDIFTRLFAVPDATDRIEFQKKVIGPDGHTKRIDAYIPETKVLIEQKSIGIDLDKPQAGHDGMTPFEQAKMYDNGLPHSEKSRWIITSNFREIWIYDMDQKKPEPVKILLEELPSKYSLLEFLISAEVKQVNREIELSKEAGRLIGKVHDRFEEQYNDPLAKKTQNSLNILCVRLVFCLYAEDAGLFGNKDAFSAYLKQYEPKDMRRALLDLFKVLDTPLDQREDLYLDDELAAFPYVNGGLFARENIEIPKLTQEIKDTLLESANFDWSAISPTIFGAVFESTLNPETRRSGGMHYTSIENIHKVIDPLFLDELKEELEQILTVKVEKDRDKQLHAFQDKLASLRFLDPSCGSGNFLTETYMSIRRLENRALGELQHGQIMFGFESVNPIKVGIDQFYGIEINDFAVTVAKTALWIAESQMMKETEDVVHMDLDFLPLRTNAFIHEGNALRMDWNKICTKDSLSYIMGNPPFVGARLMSSEQKEDMIYIFGAKWKNVGNLDYVSCWYKKCAEYMETTMIRSALVSTNSIVQGEQVPILWKPLFTQNHIHFDFAHKTFIWDSEANVKAHVHCVILGFSVAQNMKQRKIFEEGNEFKIANNINGYLIDGDNIFVESSKSTLCKDVPEARSGNKPIDGGAYLFTQPEYEEFIQKEPLSKKWFRRWYGAEEFINNKIRYCLWLGDCPPSELRKMPHCMERVQQVQNFRLASKSAGTVKLADKPTRFHVETILKNEYLIMPLTSSERRRYVPIGFMTPDALASNLVTVVVNATKYDFGVLISNVFMAWMRAVGGRLKSDYRITKDNLYNVFPWPTPTEDQKAKIEQTAQGILDARALYPDSSLADLYDPLTMPPELRKAHQKNDAAVMQAYGLSVKDTSEADCVAFLMQRYKELVDELEAKEAAEKAAKKKRK